MSFSICKCGVCGEEKSRGESLVVMRGDWPCNLCGNNNFAKRKKCFSCGAQMSMLMGQKIQEFSESATSTFTRAKLQFTSI